MGAEAEFHTFVNLVSQCDRRDELQKHLANMGVQTVVHYNTPIHVQPAADLIGIPQRSISGRRAAVRDDSRSTGEPDANARRHQLRQQ